MKLNSENLERVILDCLFKEGEDTTNHVLGEGVMVRIGYHPERLKANDDNIKSMLSCLPDSFMKSKGGGMSFLNALETKDGEQWTDLHETIDKLLSIGRASGQITMLMPREMWSALPGGMPYFAVNQ